MMPRIILPLNYGKYADMILEPIDTNIGLIGRSLKSPTSNKILYI